jgi:hypothetical protein
VSQGKRTRSKEKLTIGNILKTDSVSALPVWLHHRGLYGTVDRIQQEEMKKAVNLVIVQIFGSCAFSSPKSFWDFWMFSLSLNIDFLMREPIEEKWTKKFVEQELNEAKINFSAIQKVLSIKPTLTGKNPDLLKINKSTKVNLEKFLTHYGERILQYKNQNRRIGKKDRNKFFHEINRLDSIRRIGVAIAEKVRKKPPEILIFTKTGKLKDAITQDVHKKSSPARLVLNLLRALNLYPGFTEDRLRMIQWGWRVSLSRISRSYGA